MNNVKEKFNKAIEYNDVKNFLIGLGIYQIPDRDGFINNNILALYSGVFDSYKVNLNSNIDKLYESALIELLNGSATDNNDSF